MIGKYHRSITNDALNKYFNSSALDYIKNGNTDSDKLRTCIPGISDGFNLSAQHFNKTSLKNCKEFLENSQEVVIDDFIQAAKAQNGCEDEYYEQAFYDLGRTIHNIQDFYSHSNWINLNQDEIWNEDIKNPNVENPENFKTGEYYYTTQFIDKINPFYESFAKKHYDKMYEGNSSVSHFGLNKDEPGTIADNIFEEKTGQSGFGLATEDATAHTEKKWNEIDSILKENLSEEEYQKMLKKIAQFNSDADNYDENLVNYRVNFNSDIKEVSEDGD